MTALRKASIIVEAAYFFTSSNSPVTQQDWLSQNLKRMVVVGVRNLTWREQTEVLGNHFAEDRGADRDFAQMDMQLQG